MCLSDGRRRTRGCCITRDPVSETAETTEYEYYSIQCPYTPKPREAQSYLDRASQKRLIRTQRTVTNPCHCYPRYIIPPHILRCHLEEMEGEERSIQKTRAFTPKSISNPKVTRIPLIGKFQFSSFLEE